MSEESAPPQKKKIPLVVYSCCATKGCMIQMPSVSLALEQCAQLTWSDGQCVGT